MRLAELIVKANDILSISGVINIPNFNGFHFSGRGFQHMHCLLPPYLSMFIKVSTEQLKQIIVPAREIALEYK